MVQDAGDQSPDSVESDNAQAVSIEFLMASGETFTVQDFVEGDVLDDAIRRLGEQLAAELGTATIRRFPYWEGEDFFFDAVRMDLVAAFSISLSNADEEDEAEL